MEALKLPIKQREAQKLISHFTIVQCERLTLPLGDMWALKLYYSKVWDQFLGLPLVNGRSAAIKYADA